MHFRVIKKASVPSIDIDCTPTVGSQSELNESEITSLPSSQLNDSQSPSKKKKKRKDKNENQEEQIFSQTNNLSDVIENEAILSPKKKHKKKRKSDITNRNVIDEGISEDVNESVIEKSDLDDFQLTKIKHKKHKKHSGTSPSSISSGFFEGHDSVDNVNSMEHNISNLTQSEFKKKQKRRHSTIAESVPMQSLESIEIESPQKKKKKHVKT